MIKNYECTYLDNEAYVELEVDTSVFTDSKVESYCEWLGIDKDLEENLLDTYITHLALQCIFVSTCHSLEVHDIISYSLNDSNIPCLDGSEGIKLIECRDYGFNEFDLDVVITENAEPKPLPRALID